MKYQTTKDRSREVFDGLGGSWVLIDFDFGCDVFENTLTGDLLYIFDSEFHTHYTKKKYGQVI